MGESFFMELAICLAACFFIIFRFSKHSKIKFINTFFVSFIVTHTI